MRDRELSRGTEISWTTLVRERLSMLLEGTARQVFYVRARTEIGQEDFSRVETAFVTFQNM